MSASELQHQRAAWIAPAMFALFGAGTVVLFAVAYVYGRDARLSAERAEAIIVEREKRRSLLKPWSCPSDPRRTHGASAD
jgi:hypothetical protein